MPAWTNIPIFISSTFVDMQAERDLLVKRVFPAMRSQLQGLRVRIAEIDLRWGITAEQERNGRVLDLCLDAIERSRPHFLGFLGERYGSSPGAIPHRTRARADLEWLPTLDPPRTSVTEMEVLHGLFHRAEHPTRGLFYFRGVEGYADLPDELVPFFFDVHSGRPDWRSTDDAWFNGTVDRLTRSGLADAARQLEGWLHGTWPPHELELALSPNDRLRLLKIRLKLSGCVKLTGYPWKLQGIRVRWPLARLAIPNDRRIQALESAAEDGIVRPEALLRLGNEPGLIDFLRQYGTVALAGLDELERAVRHDLWESLLGDGRIQRAMQDQAREQRAAAPTGLDDDEKLLLAVRRFAGDALPLELKLLKGKQASELLRSELAGNPELLTQLRSFADVWDARRSAGGAEGGAEGGAPARYWDDERDIHRRYAEGRRSLYVRRPDVERRIRAHLLARTGQYLVVIGAPGDGKSALLARTVTVCRALCRTRAARTVFHFIGATAGAASLPHLIRRLSVELGLFDDDTLERLSLDVQDIAPRFARALHDLSADRTHYILIDGLDQLDSTGDAHALHWLPQALPPHVHVVLSYATDSEHGFAPALDAALHLRPTEWIDLRQSPMTEEQSRRMIERVPSLVAKSLEERHIAALLENPATRNPLYLKLALEELRGFGSFALLAARIAQFRDAESPAAMFRQVIHGLREDFRPTIVRSVLSAIACSRHGMNEAELANLAIRLIHERADAATPREIQAIQDETALLLRSLQPYLQLRGTLHDFLHRSIRTAVVHEWLNDPAAHRAAHRSLATMFEAVGRRAQPPWSDAGRRAQAETLHHYLEARDWIAVRELLNDDRFVFEKGYSPYGRELVREWSLALADAPLDQAAAMANSFARLSSQQQAMSELAGETIVALARRSHARLGELLPSLRRIGERWRGELLRAQAVLVGVSLTDAAAAVLQLVTHSFRPDEENHSDESARFQIESVQANSAGNYELGLRLAERSRQAALAGDDSIRAVIAEATMIGSLVGLQRHREAVDLTRDVLGRSRGQAGLSRIVPRAILSGYGAFVQLGHADEAESLLAEGMAECGKQWDARYDYTALAVAWGTYCLQMQKPAEAVLPLRTALAYPSDAYPEELRPRAFATLIESLIRSEKLEDAREVFQAAQEYPWSSAAAQQAMQGHLQAFVAPQSAGPADLNQLLNQALALQNRGEIDAAAELFARLLQEAPENIVVLGIVAFFMQNSLRDFEGARNLYRRANELNDADTVNQTNLASLEYILGERGQARDRIAHCIARTGGQVDEYTARIYFLAAVLATVAGDATAEPLHRLKALLTGDRPPAAWRNTALIEAVRRDVPSPRVELLQAIFDGFNAPEQLLVALRHRDWND